MVCWKTGAKMVCWSGLDGKKSDHVPQAKHLRCYVTIQKRREIPLSVKEKERLFFPVGNFDVYIRSRSMGIL